MLRRNRLTLLLSSGSLVVAGLLNALDGDWRTTGLIWVSGFGLMAVILAAFSYLGRSRERFWGAGIPGVAVVRSIEQSGTTINQQPLVTLDLEVHPEGLPPYALRKRMLVPLAALGQLGAGSTLAVRVDPAKPKRLAVDWDLSAAPVI